MFDLELLLFSKTFPPTTAGTAIPTIATATMQSEIQLLAGCLLDTGASSAAFAGDVGLEGVEGT